MKVDAPEFIADPGCSCTQNSSTCVHSTTHLPLNSLALFKYLTNHRLLQYLFYKVHVKTSSGALLRQLWLCEVGTTQSLRSGCILPLPLDKRRDESQTAACLKNWTMDSVEQSIPRPKSFRLQGCPFRPQSHTTINRFFQFLTEKSRKKY